MFRRVWIFGLVLFSIVTAQRDSINTFNFGGTSNRDFNSLGNNNGVSNSRDIPQNPVLNPTLGSAGGANRGFGFPNTFGNPRQDFGIGIGDNGLGLIPLEEKECPLGWEEFKLSCYRFVRSPIRNREDARRNCQAYGNGADLISINTLEEHTWLIGRLTAIDPTHREWYTSIRQSSPGSWMNADGSQLTNMEQVFLQDQPSISSTLSHNFLVYSFSERRKMWGLLRVLGYDLLLYICEIPLSQVPYFDKTLDDRDFEYGIDTAEDVTKIPRGPVFIQEPKSVVFDLSRNILQSYVSLSCLADGWPSPTYQWYKEEYLNNTMISIYIDPLQNGKYTISGGMLIIDSPKQLEDRGKYHCVARNDFGAVISESVTISFGYIGEFVPKRSLEIASQYWGKAIYCDPPQHYPSVLYYWSRRYFPNFVEEDQRVFVSYDGNLYISAVDMSDQDTYSCNVQSTVSNSGRNGPSFSLQVTPNAKYQQLKFPNNFPKAFPEAPSAGVEVRLECVAFGYPVPSYNWTRKGGSLPRGSVLSNYNRVLTIPKVKVEDQGEYICRATNNRLSAEDSVTLSIQAAPHFVIPIGNKHANKGDDLVWTCEAFGIPDVEYQWYRNGQMLTMETLPPEDIGRYQIQDNVLTIRELDEERDAGMYQCRSNNSLEAKYSTGQLRILILPPNFKKRPLDTETLAMEQGNVTIKCQPEAAPFPKFTWKKDGNTIGSGGRRRILSDGSLLIYPVSRDDEGVFTCLAENSLGFDESSGLLTVLRGPTIVDPPPGEHRNYTIGSTLTLRCRADADPSLDIAYVWKLNGFRLDETSYRINVDPRLGYLEIQNLTLADKGIYMCEVKTWVGTQQVEININIIGPPGQPGGVQASELTSRSALIRWTDGATNGAQAYLYTFQGRTQWDPVWRTLVENVEADRILDGRGESGRKEKLLTVLSPWSAYEFRVLAANHYGYGPPSSPSPQYNALVDRPFMAPRNVGGGGGKTNSLTITWDPLPPKDQNAPGIHYKVFWRQYRNYTGEDPYQTIVLRKWGNIGMHVVDVPEHNFYTLYEVKVQAWNDIGSGPESAPVLVFSAEDMPQIAPSLVTPIPYNSTAINVTWTPVVESRENIRGKLIGYRIRYWPKIQDETNLYDPEALNYLSRSTNSSALIVGLQPNTYYYVQAMAYNSAGPGPASEPQYERTLKKAPQRPPISVEISLYNPSTIKVTWRYVATTADEESLIGYKVRIWDADQDLSQARDTYVPFGKLEAYIDGLELAKKYYVRVLAYSTGGDGKMSSPAREVIIGDQEALKSHSSAVSATNLKTLITILFIKLYIYYPG